MKVKMTILSVISSATLLAGQCDCGWKDGSRANILCQQQCGSYDGDCMNSCCKAKCEDSLNCYYECINGGCFII
jgi:hypothetical protein